MVPPSVWAAHAHVARALQEQEPLAIWAAAGGDVEVGLAVAEVLVGRGMFVEADRLLGELSPVDAPARAALVVLQQVMHEMREEPVDVPALEHALPVLLGDARWSAALDACRVLAAGATELAVVRRLRVLAVGIAEAAGGAYTGAVQLRLLAAAELAAGEPLRCLVHLEHALRRLTGILLVGARFERARCHELACDAHLAGGDPAAARASLDQALAEYGHPDFGASHRARIVARRASLA